MTLKRPSKHERLKDINLLICTSGKIKGTVGFSYLFKFVPPDYQQRHKNAKKATIIMKVKAVK